MEVSDVFSKRQRDSEKLSYHIVEFGLGSLIYASIDPENKVSGKILSKIGFKEFGKKNDAYDFETVYYHNSR